jgi:ATPases involved in chromosome partitioning
MPDMNRNGSGGEAYHRNGNGTSVRPSGISALKRLGGSVRTARNAASSDQDIPLGERDEAGQQGEEGMPPVGGAPSGRTRTSLFTSPDPGVSQERATVIPPAAGRFVPPPVAKDVFDENDPLDYDDEDEDYEDEESGSRLPTQTSVTAPADRALVTVLPQESLERVCLSAERTEGQFAHLYAALERQIQELYDQAVVDAVHDPEVTLPTVFGITSAVTGEGKTSVALHLALTIARNSFKRVCLIDMSLGDDDIGRCLGAHVEKGVMDVLEGRDYIVRTIQVEECGDLSVMPAGKAPENAVRAARSPSVPEVIAAARQMFDLVLVDMPAVSTSNALPIAAHLDRVLMVVNAGVTPRGMVAEAIEQIGRHRVMGVVMNKIKRASPNWVQRRFGYF